METCTNEAWRAPVRETGEAAELIFDLKCPKELETFTIMNAFGDFGTQKFTLYGSKELTGPWNELFKGELKEGTEMTEEVMLVTKVQEIRIVYRILSAARVFNQMNQQQ